MADTLKVGDVVRLKSGGPKMTVTQVGTDSITELLTVWCAWFVLTKQETGTFPADAVEPVIESPEPLQTRANTGQPRRI